MSTHLCECGCGASLDGRRRSTRYVNRTHAQRAYRKRVEKEMRDRGLEPRVSLRVARAGNPTSKGNGDAKKGADARQTGRKRASGMQVSWARATRTLSYYLQEALSYDDADEMAVEILRDALSDKQRARLEARDAQ